MSVVAAEPSDPPPGRRRRHLPRPRRATRLVGAVLAEQHEEWTGGRRCLGLDILARSRVSFPTSPATEVGSEVNQAHDLQALSD
jgi:hypothetical protein